MRLSVIRKRSFLDLAEGEGSARMASPISLCPASCAPTCLRLRSVLLDPDRSWLFECRLQYFRPVASCRRGGNQAHARVPFCFSRSNTSASSAFQRGASFAASMSMLCKCMFRCWCPLTLAFGAPLGSAQPAATHCFFHRTEALDIAHLQGP
jgi:hypothetical protein